MALNPISLPKPLISRKAVNSRASILIIALWLLCLLTTFAVILGYQVRQKLTLIQRLDERDKLHFISEAGIKKAIAELKKGPQETYDSLRDAWGNSPEIFKEMNIGDGIVNISYDYYNEQVGRFETCYGLIDEERKININKATLPALERLFRIVLGIDETQAQELAACIIDWRDSDSELSSPFGSAEDPYYRNLRYSYEAKDADFEVLEELFLVKGMTQEAFGKIRDYITIYGSGKVNINTAPGAVLLALGLSEEMVNKILSFRAGEDRIVGTTDDNVFDASSNIVPKLSQFYHLSDAEIAHLSLIIQDQNLATNSDNFMARCNAKLNGGKNIAQLICVINRSGKILYWQES